MTDKEILLDLLDDFTGTLQWVIKDLPAAVLRWQPDDEANSIGVTVWHICRSFDVLTTRVLQNRAYSEEIWYTEGWAQKTSYDPHGIGFAGWGTLARFTRADVDAIPALSADELLIYFEQTVAGLRAHLSAMPPDILYQPPIGWPDLAQSAYQPESAYRAICGILMDTREHLGEIKTIKAMWERQQNGL